ncbi:ABC transporter substrate-binding protein [Paenibacillus sp. SGZ-1009]|uniref:ABC transporter substrate-binding protein n=1 Tax=Paenibacillus campi TaxID=3106031 RepID=UPI002AFFC562|nr:ABC transporter substrate-binding protein [Paenibacillus sp. SGZ-1009]
MKLHRQFLLLHRQFANPEGRSVTLGEIADVLERTHRSALTIIGNMRQAGWIDWQAQRGRGKRSLLRFLVTAEQIALESMMQTIRRGDIRTSIEQIREQARSPELDDQLQQWLLTYFGPHSEMRHDRQIDQLRLPMRQQIHTVDPLYMNLLAESFVSSHIFDGLVRKENDSGRIVPHLAHAWETDETRTVWTFYLRKDVLFHHGQTLTADDVVYTFLRLIHSSRPALYRFIFQQIATVEALQGNAVVIRLHQPCELFLPFLCTSRAGIVPVSLNRTDEQEFGYRPSGTGPFRLVERDQDRVVLEAFKPYFRGRPHLDQVEIIHIPWRVHSTDYDKRARAESETASPFQVIPGPVEGEQGGSWSQLPSPVSVRKFVTFNTHKPGVLQQPDVRRHICHCLRLLHANPNPAAAAAETTTATDRSQHNDEHEQRIKDANNAYLPSELPPLRILTIPHYRRDAINIAESLQHAGYTCEVRSVPIEQFKGDVRMESDLLVFSLIRDQDEQLRVFDLYQTMAGHVEPYVTTDIAYRLQDVLRQPDAKLRQQLFDEIEQRLVQSYQLHMLYEKPMQTTYLPTVRGITFNSQGWVDLRHIWLPPGKPLA